MFVRMCCSNDEPFAFVFVNIGSLSYMDKKTDCTERQAPTDHYAYKP